jgi:glucokinase
LLLIGDIGGTNARFALADPHAPGYREISKLKCADYPAAADAIHHYLKAVGVDTPDIICLAAAGPVVDDTIRLTNNAWTLSVAELLDMFDTARVQLLNDFTAVAYAVPILGDEQLLQIGSLPRAALDKPVYTFGVLGPGTGLGTVGMQRFGDHMVLIDSEAAHAGFAPETDRQLEVLRAMRERFERVPIEYLVSGQGIENLYWALGRVDGEDGKPLVAAEIFAGAVSGENPRAIEAVGLFFEILGQAAGDMALAFGAYAGIYVAGGIAQRYPEDLRTSRFRRGFERKGSHRYLMERIPTHLITHEQPGLLGAAYCALRMRQGIE